MRGMRTWKSICAQCYLWCCLIITFLSSTGCKLLISQSDTCHSWPLTIMWAAAVDQSYQGLGRLEHATVKENNIQQVAFGLCGVNILAALGRQQCGWFSCYFCHARKIFIQSSYIDFILCCWFFWGNTGSSNRIRALPHLLKYSI